MEEACRHSDVNEDYKLLLEGEGRNLPNSGLWWNTWFMVQEIHLHSRQTSSRNEQMPTKSTRTRMDHQRKDHIDPKLPKPRSRPKQLQTHNLPIDDVENINSTDKGRDLQLANKPRFVSWQTEKVQRNRRHSRITLHASTHPK